MKIKNISLIVMAALAFMTSCDSIEDTYKEFAGDGPIRYAGKCTDISVKPGWECLRVNWTCSDDPTVKNILVKCWLDNDTIRKELPPTATECVIDGLGNNNYTVTVQSVAGDGAMSLCDSYTERPYTYEHETVLAFTRGFTKSFFLAGHLLLFMSSWNDHIERFAINYTATDGTDKTVELTEDVFNTKYFDIPEVDASKPVMLLRKARIEGCPDVIDFQPYAITKYLTLSTDFRRNLTERYGIGNDDIEDFVEKTEMMELDNSLFSLDDLLYFGNLKKVVLGGNHYYDGKHYALPTLDNNESSQWVLTKLNEIIGTKVDVYSNSYLPKTWNPDFLSRLGDAQMPTLEYLDTTGWTISNLTEDSQNDELPNLLDNNVTTTWTAWPSVVGTREMTLTIDMKSIKDVNGVKIVQSADNATKNFQPSLLKLLYSENGTDYKDLTYVEDNTIGTAMGEATLLKASKAVKARYIRVVVKDVTYQGQVKVALADVAVY